MNSSEKINKVLISLYHWPQWKIIIQHGHQSHDDSSTYPASQQGNWSVSVRDLLFSIILNLVSWQSCKMFHFNSVRLFLPSVQLCGMNPSLLLPRFSYSLFGPVLIYICVISMSTSERFGIVARVMTQEKVLKMESVLYSSAPPHLIQL